MTHEVYIAAAKRSPIGNLLGFLSSLSAVSLGSSIIKEIITGTQVDPGLIDEVIIGQVLTAALGQNPARQVSIAAGLPIKTPAYLVGQVCGSGLKSVILGSMSIACGYSQLVISGGQESMSNATHCIYARKGQKMGNLSLLDTMMLDGLTDAFSNQAMGITAENIASKYQISRQQQDDFAYHSQQKASKAMKLAKFEDEIVPIKISNKAQEIIIKNDEFIKPETTPQTLARLRPAFIENGSVTAGNSSGINDGAAFVMLASEKALKVNNLTPLARIVSFAECGVEPNLMGTGPIPASKQAMSKAGWRAEDFDLIECNEAFAAQSICVIKELGLDVDKVNVNGGAIALGHPIGASGGRILVTLIHEMQKRLARRALATLCIGGGMGIAMCIERV
jgi:acetyl-CoA C-acetyltransferase